MYISSFFESDLMNSYAWDTALVFIQEFSKDTKYSMQYKLQSTLAKCGEATDGVSNDVRCNIYDMAGNVYEWTTETYTSTSTPCVARGGYFNHTDGYTSFRNFGMTWNAFNCSSCRPILYL